MCSLTIECVLLQALEDGKIGASALRKLWTLEAGPMAPFLALAPVRDRLLAGACSVTIECVLLLRPSS